MSPTIERPPGLAAGVSSWVEIDVAALRRNVAAFRARLRPGTRFMAVVKSDAYGHDARLCAPAALAAGADWLGAGGLGEAVSLRRLVGPEVPILTLNPVPTPDLETAVEHDIRVMVSDPQALPMLARAAQRLGTVSRVHLKVETGTHRQGLPAERVVELAREAARTSGLEFEGLATHFADIEDTTDHEFATAQRLEFERCVRVLEAEGQRPRIRHTACSAAAILFPETHGDLARSGIGIYGLWPSRETRVSARERGLKEFELHPVATWKCLVAQIQEVPVGGYVGYGRTWRATRPSRIAILPVGYYEGYDRGLSGRGHVLIAGRRAPVTGRICMNMTMVDVTDIPDARPGGTAVLMGSSGEETLRAEDLAAWAGTIHYEIVARIHPALPRLSR